MKHIHTAAFIAAMAILLPAFASKADSAPTKPSTRVETDQAAGIIRFIVKGKEEARIDSDGLHVRHGIAYGNTMTDEGAVGYERLVAHAP